MPAGDLITGDWQIELRALLMGDTTNYELDRTRGGIQGLGEPPVRMANTPFAHKNGVYAGENYYGPRLITVALEINHPEDATAAGNSLDTLKTAWAKATSADIPLYFRVPGIGKKFVNGRPGFEDTPALVADYTNADFGVIPVLCTFFCPDPTINT